MRTLSHDGLYDPQYEHDACGIGFVANIDGRRSHDVVRQGIQVLENLVHRGACGCDPDTGDGAGMTFQQPHEFFLEEAERLGFALPDRGKYAAGMVFMPHDAGDREACRAIVEKHILAEGQKVLGWRDVPRNSSALGWLAREGEPVIQQVFVRRAEVKNTDAFERKLYLIRKQIEREVHASDLKSKDQFYICSLSARTIVYKGLMLADQIQKYYVDLENERFTSALAMVHQRYSTNTFPAWRLAHPYRFLCHNGEINTLRGNINAMTAREANLASPHFGDDIEKLKPILTPGASD
ncbi:MAG: glutamate synthase subunit alpha, partial [Candidatus Hydrogenedentota bacterium]